MGTLFSLLLIFAEREVFRPTEPPDGAWNQPATWRATKNTPSADDRVLIPGRKKHQRSVVVPADTHAVAASVFVGAMEASEGSLTVEGRLSIRPTAADTQAGFVYVGRSTGDGTILQQPGSSVVAESIHIGSETGSAGTYSLQDSSLVLNGDLLLGAVEDGASLLDLFGSASVHSERLSVGLGRSRIRLTADASHVPRIYTQEQSKLAGSVRVDLRELTDHTAEEILLINNLSSLEGGFRTVRIDSGSSQHYELTYFGGDGNDVTLAPVVPAESFDQWIERRFATDDPRRGPLADPDVDGLSNIGEYKLGCCPETHEGALWRSGTDSQGRPFIRYVERTDRTDVRATPQTTTNGSCLWSADGVTTRVVERFGNTRTVKATATDSDAELRLAFELLPDASEKPNVVFVVVDDLNDWVEGFGGHSQTITPNFACVASRGIRFTNAHCNSAICNPSRVSMLTGRWPSQTGIYDNDGDLRNSPVLAEARTIPENFKAAGYRITGGGKLFHGDPLLPSWDEYFPFVD